MTRRMTLVSAACLLVTLALLVSVVPPCFAEPPAPDESSGEWEPKENVDEIPPPVAYSQLIVAPPPLPKTTPTISAYIKDSKGQRTSEVVGNDTWYLIVEMNWPGRLSLYEYYPKGAPSKGRWITYRWDIPKGGTWQIGPFSPQPKEPEGEHAWKMWFQAEGQIWACTVSWKYLKSKVPPIIEAFKANPDRIDSGQSATLNWTVLGATTITIDNDIGEVEESGKKVVQPTKTTVYTLLAANSAGNSKATTTVNFGPLPPPRDGQRNRTLLLLGAALAVALGVIGFLAYRQRSRRLEPMSPATQTAVSGDISTTVAPDMPATTAATMTSTKMGKMPATTASLPPGADATVIVRGRLVMADSNEIRLTEGTKAIGRADFKSIVPPDKLSYISRRHLMVSYENGDYFIEDEDSGNGTKLNGADIKGKGKYKLSDGDKIELSEVVTLTFRTG